LNRDTVSSTTGQIVSTTDVKVRLVNPYIFTCASGLQDLTGNTNRADVKTVSSAPNDSTGISNKALSRTAITQAEDTVDFIVNRQINRRVSVVCARKIS
jgi:hypothetical protein